MPSVRASLVASLAALLLPLVAAPGCTSDTGLIVEVTRNGDNTMPGIEKLEFVVGVGSGSGADYRRDDSSSVMVSMDGRDLAIDPYQLLLRDAQQNGQPSQVMVAVLAYQADQVVAFGAFDAPQTFMSGKILLRSIELNGDTVGRLTATGCLSWDTPSGTVTISSTEDKDCDGDTKDVDCNDTDPTVGPSRGEVCENGVDDDCDLTIDEQEDGDADGVSNCAGDCDDANPATFPGAEETCDGKDNDCNLRCDDGKLDLDEDGFNTCGGKIHDDGVCEDIGQPDCDDLDETVHPFATEACDGVDDDCNGMCDDGDMNDVDDDGFTVCGSQVGDVGPGGARCGTLVQGLRDCDDLDGEVHPFADEVCDGKDTDCDGSRLAASPCYTSDGMAGECRAGERPCDDDGADGTSGYGVCTAGTDALVPVEFCGAYDACEAMSADDPWACANSTLAFEQYGCQLYHVGATLCPVRTMPLAGSAVGATCSWGILGGMNQEHYVVGLTVAGSGPQPAVDACDASFEVLSKLDLIPQDQQVFIGYQDDTNMLGKLVEINILPMPVPSCPMTGGMHCSLLP